MNPFVNPNQRGPDLPVGCKDLADLLQKYPGWGEGILEPVELVEVRSLLPKLLGSDAGQMLIADPSQKISVSIIHDRGQPDLLIFVYGRGQGLDKVLAEIFGGKSVSPPNAEQNSRLITVPTRSDPEDLAKRILEMFRRGFGMSE